MYVNNLYVLIPVHGHFDQIMGGHIFGHGQPGSIFADPSLEFPDQAGMMEDDDVTDFV